MVVVLASGTESKREKVSRRHKRGKETANKLTEQVSVEEWRGEDEGKNGVTEQKTERWPRGHSWRKQTDNTAITSIFILWLHAGPVCETTHLEYTLGKMILGFSLRFLSESTLLQ